MKTTNHLSRIKNLSITVLLLCLLFLSCKEQDEMFREYVKVGGITYLGSVSDLDVRIGYERLEINFSIVDLSTTNVGIYWNDYQDSVIVNIGDEKIIRQIINLPEGQYSLFLKSFDANGNSSNPVELITRTVGENYLTSISNRGIKSKITGFNNDLSIEWAKADNSSGDSFTELTYTDTNDKEKRIKIKSVDENTIIDDYKQGTTFKRITYYSPDKKWLDTIATPEAIESSLIIDKRIGKVIDFSSEWPDPSTYAYQAYDGLTTNRWHSLGDGYPHFITIDLGIIVDITRFGIWPSTFDGSPDIRMPSKIRWEVSMDNIDWINVGEFDYDNSTNNWDSRLFDVVPTKARYVKLWGLTNDTDNTGIMCLGEIDAYAKLSD